MRRCLRCGIGRATKRTSLSSRADKTWADIVKLGKVCAACGKPGALEAAHIVPRRFRSTRWLVENGRALCHHCHRRFTNNESGWRMFIGEEYERLWELAQKPWDGDYPEVFMRLRLGGFWEGSS